MNILYLGHFFPPELIKTINDDSKGKVGFSNHNFELSIINGLASQDDVNLKVITIPNIYSFPYNNRKIYTPKEIYKYQDISIRSIGFLNLPFIKDIISTTVCAFRILQLLKSFPEGKVNVIINTPSKRLLDSLNIARHLTRKDITQTVIVPDIPSFVSGMDKYNRVKRWLLNRRERKVMTLTSKSNGLVVLTEAMMELFSPKPKHIVMEGIVDINRMDAPILHRDMSSEKILYTGTLRRIFGIMNLVEAFKLIPDNNVELWICGSGEAADQIIKAAETDQRIRFYGLVSSKKALELQRKATILVNPRTSQGEYTRFSFPSKTMEYLLTGKSTVIHKLPGIPEEYYNFVFTPEDETVMGLAKCLQKVLGTEHKARTKLAEAGRNFIVTQKNSILQTHRIIKLIESYN